VQYGEVGNSSTPSDGLCSKEKIGSGFTKLNPDCDPAGAKQLLAEAGYADGFDIAISAHSTSVVPATAGCGKVEIGFCGWCGGALFETSGQIVRHVGSKEYDDPDLANMAGSTFAMMDDAERRKAVVRFFD